MPDVSNSAFVVGALLAGFVLWLALNNRLGTYWNLLIGGGGSGTSGSGGSGSGSSSPSYIIPPVPSLGFPGVTG